MKQKENEKKGKELFELSLTFTEGEEDKDALDTWAHYCKQHEEEAG